MFKAIVAFIFLAGFLSGFSRPPGPEPAIRAVKIIWNLGGAGMANPDDTVLVPVNISDSIFLFYDKDKMVYKLPHTESVHYYDRPSSWKTRYSYLSHLKGADYGLFFDSLGANSGKRLNVDSLLKEKISYRIVLDDYSLVETVKLSDQGVMIEKYGSQITNHLAYPDTALLYYTTGLKDVDYSISDSLDHAKGQKLFKVRFVSNSQYYQDHPLKMPRREISLELKEFQVSSAMENEIRKFFGRTGID
ncbi:hypothetical protein EDD80_11544 [Anseongella ginsenosidimutans]|uniref:Uncharacterized protein n=1 Tax=Anseongella ginsenosidimutans TaxID=496056 RepID=A0A4R3KLP6_9SPHI|nr:hypothetical protein [Anseongella ginsenosidimutans]QEC51914.1 hypothetical protein FRZ59_05910 [Anseongella ginsenosidimutans]TCS85061.1 hypothetical protein EDD80_11544 [Anseongella ginsenosidimutans]